MKMEMENERHRHSIYDEEGHRHDINYETKVQVNACSGNQRVAKLEGLPSDCTHVMVV